MIHVCRSLLLNEGRHGFNGTLNVLAEELVSLKAAFRIDDGDALFLNPQSALPALPCSCTQRR